MASVYRCDRCKELTDGLPILIEHSWYVSDNADKALGFKYEVCGPCEVDIRKATVVKETDHAEVQKNTVIDDPLSGSASQ